MEKTYTISDDKLSLGLKVEIFKIPETKKYLIISILRESDFSPQAIKDVLSFLPKMKLDDEEVNLWEKKLSRSYNPNQIEHDNYSNKSHPKSPRSWGSNKDLFKIPKILKVPQDPQGPQVPQGPKDPQGPQDPQSPQDSQDP